MTFTSLISLHETVTSVLPTNDFFHVCTFWWSKPPWNELPWWNGKAASSHQTAKDGAPYSNIPLRHWNSANNHMILEADPSPVKLSNETPSVTETLISYLCDALKLSTMLIYAQDSWLTETMTLRNVCCFKMVNLLWFSMQKQTAYITSSICLALFLGRPDPYPHGTYVRDEHDNSR
jgi:hypothetical protein